MAKLWVRFKPYNPTQVSTDGCDDVDDFIKATKKELQMPNPPQELFLTTTDGGPSLKPGDPLPAQNTDDTPLFISVAALLTTTSSPLSSESSLTGKQPHPMRKKRWEQLNEILEKNAKMSKTSGSTAY